jgi:glutamate-1-semialdehyde 2,1-aminomutase
MKVIAIVQARMGSQRLPGKVLLGLQGQPLLAHVLKRAAAIEGVNLVVLAIPERDQGMLSHLWKHVYVGEERNVLCRYLRAAEFYRADVILRITGDCPLFAPDIATDILKQFLADPNRYMPGCQPFIPNADGFDVEIFSMDALISAYMVGFSETAREHVTTIMRTNAKDVRVPKWNYGDMTNLKFSVDTMADLRRVEAIMTDLKDDNYTAARTIHAWNHVGCP